MAFVILAVAAITVALAQIAVRKEAWTRQRIAELLLVNLFFFAVGLRGIFAFLGHTIRATAVVASIGWPAGNPFQYEVAVANLAFGVLGILCTWSRGFWNATAIGWSVFMLGAAGVHISPDQDGSAVCAGQCRSNALL
jgi:hypothetical protein